MGVWRVYLVGGVAPMARGWHHRGVSSMPMFTPDPAFGDAPGEPAGGRRRRARGEQGFQRDSESGLLADRPDVLSVPEAPTRRLVSLGVAAFAAILCMALVLGAYASHQPYALVIFGVQFLFVVSWTIAVRPPGARVVAAVGLATAASSDFAVALPVHATIAPLGYVTAVALFAAMIGQIARRGSRPKVTESLGATLLMVVGVVALATLITLSRLELGRESIVACLSGAGVAVVVARLSDIVFPFPRTIRQVARGTIGIVAGAMAGTIASAIAGSMLQGLHPSPTVYAGLLTAVAAVMADLGVGYAEAGREIEGEVGRLWVVRHLQGPLVAFALAAPVAYAMSVMVLVPGLS